MKLVANVPGASQLSVARAGNLRNMLLNIGIFNVLPESLQVIVLTRRKHFYLQDPDINQRTGL